MAVEIVPVQLVIANAKSKFIKYLDVIIDIRLQLEKHVIFLKVPW